MGGSSSDPVSNNNDNKNTVNYTPNYDNQPDTYDITSVLDGEWVGVRGNGTAKGADGSYNVRMTSLQANFSNTKIDGNTGTTVLTGSQVYDAFTQSGIYVNTTELYSDGDTLKMIHAGENTWRCEYPNGTVLTFTATSPNTGQAKQEGVILIYGNTYNYVIEMEITKR